MAKKPGKKRKENPVGSTEEGQRWKGNKRRVGEVTLVRLALIGVRKFSKVT